MHRLICIVFFLGLLHCECSGYCRVINPHKPLIEQFNKTNAKYVIKSDIDLHGSNLVIPQNSTLLFEGGAFSNGVVIGNNTLLKGGVKLEKVAGSFRNDVFCSSWSSTEPDYYKLKNILSISVKSLLLDENFSISSFDGAIETSISSLKCQGNTIEFHCDLVDSNNNPNFFIVFKEPLISISGICVRMNNHAAKGFACIHKTSNKCNILDIFVDGINLLNSPAFQKSFVHGIDVSVSDQSSIIIENVEITNVSALGNGVIGDPDGSIAGLYVHSKANEKVTVEILNCRFSEMHNILGGEIILEDVAGIFVSEGFPVSSQSSIYIHDIKGYNFGKRLIKTNCSNIRIENIEGESYKDDTLSLISINSGYNQDYSDAYVTNVSFTGKAQYVISSSIRNNFFDRVYSTITDNSEPFSTALFIPSDCRVNHLRLSGAQQIAVIKNEGQLVELSSIDYEDMGSNHSLYAHSAFITSNANLIIRDAKVVSKSIKWLFTDNYPSNTSYKTNVKVAVEGLHFISSVNSNDYFLKAGSSVHDNQLHFTDCSFLFNEPVRGFLGVESASGCNCLTDVRLKNVEIIYKNVDVSTIPYGVVSVTDSTFLTMENVRVQNSSGTPFSPNIYPIYIRNFKENQISTKRNLILKDCDVDLVPLHSMKKSISLTGYNIDWQQ